MNTKEHPRVSLHNIEETTPAAWTNDGDRLCRVPASVSKELNDEARNRLRHPTNGEIRFIPESGTSKIEITLSASDRTPVRVFWGSFQPWKTLEIDSTSTTFTVSVPNRLVELDPTVDVGRFHPHVCRILFDRFTPVALHDVTGDCRPPVPDELPNQRYLAYGTSITEGAKASAPHLGYVSHVARNCGFDSINLGCSGSAYCEPAMADYIADREDWDVATLALSVNMANSDFSLATFRDRIDYFVKTIAAAHPDKPIVCVTLFPYFADITKSGDADRAAAFRSTLRSVVDDSSYDNLSLLEGPTLLSPAELTWDVLHPGDDGMRSIGTALERQLKARDE